MFSIVRALIDRFKALFVTHAVLELEAELIAVYAERKAELLRRATQYEQEGLHVVADDLRKQIESHTIAQPLGSILATIAHLQVDQAVASKPSVLTTPTVLDSAPHADKPTLPARKKKNSKS